MLTPLEQFYCDTCREIIKKPVDGFLEWDQIDHKNMNFRITHNTNKCLKDSNDRMGNHLQYYLGQDGLNRLICMIHVGEIEDPTEKSPPDYKSNAEFAEIFRRLHIEYYEEGRLYLREALADGHISHNPYSQHDHENLKNIIQKYSED